MLEPKHPQLKQDHIVIVKADLLIHYNATVAVYVTHSDVVIAICRCAGFAYAFHLADTVIISSGMSSPTMTHYSLEVDPDVSHIHD